MGEWRRGHTITKYQYVGSLINDGATTIEQKTI